MAYRIEEIYSGGGGDAGYNVEYALVDPKGNRIAAVMPTYDDYGNISGYAADISTSGGEAGGSSSFVPIDLAAINARAAQGEKAFGTGMGPALGYEYAMKNAYGDEFRRFDAEGNLKEFLDKDGKWQAASTFKPTGLVFNPTTGNLETAYRSPNSPRENITESTATTVNPYKEDQGGFLGEGGWQNLAKLALTGLSAGFAAPAMAALQGAGLGTIASGALYGGLTGAAGGAITGGGEGALTGGLLGAAGGGAMAALGGGGADAFPVEPPNANFTGLETGDFGTWGVGEFQPYAGGDVGLGSGYVTQFNPDGSYVTLAGAPDYTYSVDAAEPDVDVSSVETEEFDPNARILTLEEAENLMRYNILPADMQTPAVYDWLETPKNLLSGEYGGIIKGGLTIGALAAANALKPQQDEDMVGGGLTSEQLKALVDAMPSMIDQYVANAQNVPPGTGANYTGYNPGTPQGLAELFPTFALPTEGPFYGAGRFGQGYAPNAPIIKV